MASHCHTMYYQLHHLSKSASKQRCSLHGKHTYMISLVLFQPLHMLTKTWQTLACCRMYGGQKYSYVGGTCVMQWMIDSRNKGSPPHCIITYIGHNQSSLSSVLALFSLVRPIQLSMSAAQVAPTTTQASWIQHLTIAQMQWLFAYQILLASTSPPY